MNQKLVYQGSVKNIWADESNDESLYFEFTDKYSIYDWGEMPNRIPEKGKALLHMAEAIFELLPIENHFIKREQEFFEVQKVNILKPRFLNNQFDYTDYQNNPTNILIPLEVIFRFGVPEGSSLLKRSQDKSYLESIGVNETEVQEGVWLSQPLIEFSTKLEPIDRYLSHAEAQKISGLSDKEFTQLKKKSLLIAESLEKIFKSFDIELWDGKLEFALDKDRSIILVDSIGPDELRLIYNGKHLSKECLRQAYQGTDWLSELNEKKANSPKWKDKMTTSPEPLSDEFVSNISKMYMKLCDLLYERAFGKKVFNIPFSFYALGEK